MRNSRLIGPLLVLVALLCSTQPLGAQATSVFANLGRVSSIGTTPQAPNTAFGALAYPTKHTIQINPLSKPSSCTAVIEFSLDGAYWFSATNNQTCTIPEVLSETDFATHANWASADDFDDTGGNCAYTHSAGSGTCTQASGGFATTASASDIYTFIYTVTGVSGDVACNITSAFAAETTALTVSAGVQSTSFTSAPTPGDFVISCTSSSGGATFDDVSLKNDEGVFVTIIDEHAGFVRGSVTALAGTSASTIRAKVETLDENDFATHADWATTGDFVDTGGNGAYTHSSGTGTLVQADAGYDNALVASQLYTIQYTVSSPSGDPVCQITSGCSATIDLDETAGAKTTECTSSATVTDDFTITCTSTSGGITFDDIFWYQQNCANEDPVHIITTADHGLATGDKVTITGAAGNTACNVTARAVTVVDADEFTVDSIAGNAEWTSGGTITTAPEIEFLYVGSQ